MGWRTKLVSLLMVYAAGFLTAVYCLAPAPEPKTEDALQVARVRATLESRQLAESVNSGMHKCIGFGRQAAQEAARLIREKIDEAQSQSQQRG